MTNHKEQLANFLREYRDDPEVQAMPDAVALVAFAQARGYEFDVDAVEHLAASVQGGELGDAELEHVSGGFTKVANVHLVAQILDPRIDPYLGR